MDLPVPHVTSLPVASPGFFPTVHLSLWVIMVAIVTEPQTKPKNTPQSLLLHEPVPQVGERSLVQRVTAGYFSPQFTIAFDLWPDTTPFPKAGWDISPHTFILCSLAPPPQPGRRFLRTTAAQEDGNTSPLGEVLFVSLTVTPVCRGRGISHWQRIRLVSG